MQASRQTQLGVPEQLLLTSALVLAVQTVQHPFTRVKLLLQTQHEIVRNGRLDRPYRNARDCFTRVFRTEGFLAFWRGNMAAVLSHIPAQTFGIALKRYLHSGLCSDPLDSYAKKILMEIASGGVAGILTSFSIYSVTYAHTRLATDVKVTGKGRGVPERQFKGIVDVYAKTFQQDGIVSLYRGTLAACVCVFVQRGLYFGLYDTISPLLLGEKHSLPAAYAFAFAVNVGAGLVAYPFNTVQLRMMMRSCEAVKYKGVLDCVSYIWSKEGALGFMRGAGVNVLKVTLGAISFLAMYKVEKMYTAWRLKGVA